MSLDIEVFSVDVFRQLWHKCSFVSSVLPRLRRYEHEGIELEVHSCIASVVHVVWCRAILFVEVLPDIVKDGYNLFSQSRLDFYLFIKNNVDATLPHSGITLIEKMFMTLAFVTEMGFWCHKNNNRMFLYVAPFCWSLYFETEMKEQFFAEGGWEELERVVKTYSVRKMFCTKHIMNVKYYVGEKSLAKFVYETADEFYNLPDVDKYFKELYLRRENKTTLSCSHCYPLFVALKSRSFSEDNVTDNAALVEGYVQLILRLLPDNELNELYMATVIQSSLFDLCQTLEKMSCQEFSEKEKVKDDKLQTEMFKKHATNLFIGYIFADQHNSSDDGRGSTDNDSSGASCDFVPCIFCSRDAKKKPKVFKKETLENGINFIKSSISYMIEKPEVPSLNLKSVKETKDSCKSTKSNKDKCKKKLATSNQVHNDSNEDGDAIKMFHVLGVDPGKTAMLDIINKEISSTKT